MPRVTTQQLYDALVKGLADINKKLDTLKPQPTPQPSPQPIPQPTPVPTFSKLYGVNMAGGDFGTKDNYGEGMPGVLEVGYTYPKEVARYKYFTQKGMTLFRMPFRWERVKKKPGELLSSADIYGVIDMLEAAKAAGGLGLLDMHNYGRYYGNEATTTDLPAVWVEIVKKVKDHPALWGIELMNEPMNLSYGYQGWKDICQAVISAVRQAGYKGVIVVPGYDWQSADRWQQSNPTIHTLSDPQNNLVFGAHVYFDSDASGQRPQESVSDVEIGKKRIANFIAWLRQHKLKGMITEFGIPNNNPDPKWLQVLDIFMKKIDTTPELIGGTYWAAGPWWGNNYHSVENDELGEKKPMTILSKYPSN